MTPRRRPSKTLATMVTISVGINVQVIEDNGQAFLTTVPLLPLPVWPAFWWILAATLHRFLRIIPQLGTAGRGVWHGTRSRAASVLGAACLAVAILVIGLKAFLYGLGVDL